MRMSVRACVRTLCLAVIMRIAIAARMSIRTGVNAIVWRMIARPATAVQMGRRRWFGWRWQTALLAQILPRRHLVVVFIAAAVEVRDKSLTRFLVHVAEERDVRVLEA